MIWLRTVTFVALCGVLTMQATADEPKKDEPKPKDPAKLESYDEKVTVRRLNGKVFLKPVKDVPAYRMDKKGGGIVFTTWTRANDAESPKGSEITDKDGNVYVVTRNSVSNLGYSRSVVELKPKDK